MFLVVVILVLAFLHGYVGIRIIEPFSISASSLCAYWAVIVLLAVTPVAGIVLRYRGVENRIIDLILYVGYTSLGLFTLAFVFFLARDLVWLFSKIGEKLIILFNGDYKGSAALNPERRKFLLMSMNLGIVGLTGVLGAVGFAQAKKLPQIFRHRIPLRYLPSELAGLKIVQISDLHVGPSIKADYVSKVVEQVNAQKADLIFFTGDMVDGSVEHLSPDVEPLRQLEAKYGVYFVTGNHEYYSGVDFWLEKVKELGMRNLHNEHEILEIKGHKLAIAGITDLMAHQINASHKSDPQLALKGVPAQTPTILLAHQPGSVLQCDGLDIGLTVCGHTHGGQYFPFHYAVTKVQPFVAGLYEHGNTTVYVNQGTGYWGPPLRLGIPSEITVFTLEMDLVS